MIAFNIRTLLFYGLCFVLTGCCKEDTTPWKISEDYSEWLTVAVGNYKVITGGKYKVMPGRNSAETVEALQIYRYTDRLTPRYNLSWIFDQELVFETEDKEFINRFFMAAQKRIESICPRWSEEKHYVVALDNTYMRAGVFILHTCEIDGITSGIIEYYSISNSIYRNSALIEIFKEINLLPPQTRTMLSSPKTTPTTSPTM